MDEHELRMASYRNITNNLIVKSMTKTLSGEEALFKETSLAYFAEDLRVLMLFAERNRKQLEKDLENGTFDKSTGGSTPEGASSEEP